MKITKRIHFEFEDLDRLSYWDEETEKDMPIFDDQEVASFLKRTDWKEKLIGAINSHIEGITASLFQELEQIWQEIESLKK